MSEPQNDPQDFQAPPAGVASSRLNKLKALKAAREKLAQKRAEKAAAPKDEAAAEVDPKKLEADLSVFLRGAWVVAGWVAYLFGFRLSPLSDDEAKEDAKVWVPVAARYSGFGHICGFLAAPVHLLKRISEKLHRREPKTIVVEPSPRGGLEAVK